MISAWARMCKIMGKDFEQYLPLVMGPVLKAAALKPEVALLDSMCLDLDLSTFGLYCARLFLVYVLEVRHDFVPQYFTHDSVQ